MENVFLDRKHKILSSSLVGNWEGISVRYSNNGSASSTTIWRDMKIDIVNNVLGMRNGKYTLVKGEGYSQWKNHNIPFDVVIKSRDVNTYRSNINNSIINNNDDGYGNHNISNVSNMSDDDNWHKVCGITVEKVHKSVDFTNKVCYDDCYYGSCRAGQLLSFIENDMISSHGSINNDISKLCIPPSGGNPLNVIWNVKTNHGYMKLMKLDYEAAAIWRAWLAARGLAREIISKSLSTKTNNDNNDNNDNNISSVNSSADNRVSNMSKSMINMHMSASSTAAVAAPLPTTIATATNPSSYVSSPSRLFKDKAKEKAIDLNKDKTSTKIPVSVNSTSTSSSSSSSSSSSIADRDLCKLCCSVEIDCVIIPCGHYCLCLTCGLGLTACPFCRRGIDRLQPMFRV